MVGEGVGIKEINDEKRETIHIDLS